MNDTNVRYTIIDEMEEAGIVRREGTLNVREADGRTYIVAVAIFDVTNWSEEK